MSLRTEPSTREEIGTEYLWSRRNSIHPIREDLGKFCEVFTLV
jgi:hypothetical protein